MDDLFQYADELGPAKILHLYEPRVGLKVILVVDNVAKGPSIGGIRLAPDVSLTECVRLARAMTYKNAAAGLPHGGGKVVVYANPKMAKSDKEPLMRALAKSLRTIEEYILAPDMGTDEECMAWIRDEIGRVVGLPRELGGIPLDEIGATGWGLSHATAVALRASDMDAEKARVVIQGFGAVGRHAARFLTGMGAKLVATCDSRGAIHNVDGLDVEALVELKNAGRSVADYADGRRLDRDAVIDIDCDIWIPAARPDVINESNVHCMNTRLVIEGANIPLTHEAERYLHEKGILCVPDFIANAGGVICAAMEYKGATQSAALAAIEEKVRRNTETVLTTAINDKILPREAAVRIARERVERAMGFRRWSLFSSAPGFV